MPTSAKMAKHWKWQAENTHRVHTDTEVIQFNASAVLELKKKKKEHFKLNGNNTFPCAKSTQALGLGLSHHQKSSVAMNLRDTFDDNLASNVMTL
jgi:hypothetical protein